MIAIIIDSLQIVAHVAAVIIGYHILGLITLIVIGSLETYPRTEVGRGLAILAFLTLILPTFQGVVWFFTVLEDRAPRLAGHIETLATRGDRA